jgi:hypothetical protein
MQLREVGPGQLDDQLISCRGEFHADDPGIISIWEPADEAGRLGAVDKFYRAVRPQEQIPREIANCWRLVPGVAFDGHE